MSDNGEQKEKERDAYVLPFPFPAVDAALYDHLAQLPPAMRGRLHIKYSQTTAGSTAYELSAIHGEQAIFLVTITVRMINYDRTYVAARYGHAKPDAPPVIVQAMMDIIPALVEGIYTEQERIHLFASLTPQRPGQPLLNEDLLQQLATSFQPREPKKRGAPARALNEWARQQIQDGRDREEVFQEFLARQKIDRHDEWKVATARDRFRKAISRTKRT